MYTGLTPTALQPLPVGLAATSLCSVMGAYRGTHGKLILSRCTIGAWVAFVTLPRLLHASQKCLGYFADTENLRELHQALQEAVLRWHRLPQVHSELRGE